MHRELVSGLVLAGGKSRRFGSNKANHSIRGRRMIEHVLDAVWPLVRDVRVSVRSEGDAPDSLDVGMVVDRFPGCGPLAGVHAGLSAVRSPWLMVVACDVPFLTSSDLRLLIDACCDDVHAVVAVSSDGRRHPLCACYHRTLLRSVEQRLNSDDYSMHGFLDVIDVAEVLLPDGALLNVNSRSDLSV